LQQFLLKLQRHSRKAWPFQYAFAWLPAAAIIFAYWSVLENGLVWDDFKAFVQYPYYRDIDYLWRTFSEPLVFLPDYYRPLTSSTYTLQNHWLGVNAKYLHAASLFLHIANTMLVAYLLKILLEQWGYIESMRALPLVAGLLYGLHPALVESVSFASVRFDQLVTLFLLSALVADRSIAHRTGRPVAVAILFLLAALSKEMAATLALVLPTFHLACARERNLNPVRWATTLYRQRDAHVYVAVFLAGLIYLLIRYAALGYLVSGKPTANVVGATGLSHFLLVFRSLSEYLVLIVFPFNQLTPAHPVRLPLSVSELANWIPLTTGLLVAGLIASSRWLPRSSWLGVATILSLAPVINIIPLNRPTGSFFSESYLVFPVALAVLAISVFTAEVRDKIPEKFHSAWMLSTKGVLFLWLIGSLLMVTSTVPIWKSDHSLWLWASLKHPDSATARINLSSALYNKGLFKEALVEANKAVELEPKNPFSWVGRGRALTKLDRLDEAAAAMEKAIAISGGSVVHWHNLALTRLAQGRLNEARDILLQTVLAKEPDNVQALGSLGLVYLRLGDNRSALHYFRETRERAVDERRIGFLDQQIRELEAKLAK